MLVDLACEQVGKAEKDRSEDQLDTLPSDELEVVAELFLLIRRLHDDPLDNVDAVGEKGAEGEILDKADEVLNGLGHDQTARLLDEEPKRAHVNAVLQALAQGQAPIINEIRHERRLEKIAQPLQQADHNAEQ